MLRIVALVVLLSGCAGAPVEQAAKNGAREAARVGGYLGGIAIGQQAARAITH